MNNAPYVSYRGWKLVQGAWTSEPVYYRANKKANAIQFGSRSGARWMLALDEFAEIEKFVGSSCRNCRKNALEILIYPQRKEISLLCENCGRTHKMIDGKPYLKIDWEVIFTSLLGDLGRSV